MTDYRNFTYRVTNVGLNLRNAPDRIEEGQWLDLTNIQSTQEALLDTRQGRQQLLAPLGAAGHTLRRLDSATLLRGAGTTLYRNSTAFSTIWSGNPLQIVIFRPETVSEVWAFVTDGTKMRRVSAAGDLYQWGITAPATAVAGADGGAGNLDSSVPGAIVYDWRVTYASSITGSESNPSPVGSGIALSGGKQALVGVTASSDPQVDQIKIYRRGGTNPSTWRLSVVAPNTSGSVVDNNADSTIALADVLKIDNYLPFTSVDSAGGAIYGQALPYIWGPFVGKYILACGDPNRPGWVYWTNAARPDTADIANAVQVTSPNEPLVGGGVYQGQTFAFSRDNLHWLDFNGTSATPTFSPRKSAVGRGMARPYGLAIGPMIYFVSQDGIYETDGQGPANSLTEMSLRPLFRGDAVGDYPAVDLTKEVRLAYSHQELHFFYQDDTATRHHLVYHTLYQRWKRYASDTDVSLAYGDENQETLRTLYLDTNGAVWLEDGSASDGGASIGVSAMTGYLDFGIPQTYKEFGNLILDADPQGGTITITPRSEATGALPLASPLSISGTGRQKFPLSLQDIYVHSLALEFEWTGAGTIYQAELLWRPDEEGITHWEFPETTHGISGWQQVRDLYLAIRSTADCTLTVENDGNVETYTVASTGGNRRKVHVWLNPRKGKVWRYKVDSSSPFRIYGTDCEVRVKPWNTALGYALVSPWVPAGA